MNITKLTMANRTRKTSFRGERLREAREKKGVTQAQLEEALKISEHSVSRYENNRSRPHPDVLHALANFLGVTTDWLLGLTDDPTVSMSEHDLTPREKQALLAFREQDANTLMRLMYNGNPPKGND